jgi:glycosyltransferase involved in cell wall biosynthesis
MHMVKPIPRVSIGLPVFNGENYIRAAIDSILAQTYTDFELIICDNASTDATETICRQYAERDRRIRYVRNPHNVGASANFNSAFWLSTGEYFKWAAHDDLLGPTCIGSCVATLDREPDAVLAQPLVGLIDSNGTMIATTNNELELGGSPRPSDRFAALIRQPRTCWETFGLIRRDALARTALITPYSMSDITLTAELALLGRFVLVPKVLFLNRDHPTRFSRSAILDREESWRWWCSAGGQRCRLIDLCPNWQIQADFWRMIRKHMTSRGERRRAYGFLLRHILTSYVLSRLLIEFVTALDPRVLAAGRQIKRWFQPRSIPALGLDPGSYRPAVRK